MKIQVQTFQPIVVFTICQEAQLIDVSLYTSDIIFLPLRYVFEVHFPLKQVLLLCILSETLHNFTEYVLFLLNKV